MRQTDVVVIGGGPAGMAAAIESARNGAKTIIIERNEVLGGILMQCIHNGFGLAYFKEELTGPEYAYKFRELVKKEKNITVMTSTFVTKIKGKTVTIVNSSGIDEIEAGAIVLAMGARERTAANILLQGTRPAGVLTAGQAQKMTNIDGKLPGKNIVILGSGDIGLIMARRLTLEGARVKAVLEINKTTSGLKRNIVQCLEDFKIPLLMQTTIVEVVGENRVEGVYISAVDDNYNFVGEKKFVKCDTVILSVGLIPETDLVDFADINTRTNGPVVDDFMETSAKGVFACGNFLHVHDLVDNVTLESMDAGANAADFALAGCKKGKKFCVIAGNNISYANPSFVHSGDGIAKIRFRLKSNVSKKWIRVVSKDEVLAKKFVMAGLPGEMQTLEVSREKIKGDILLEVEG
ncbi:MAG: FAD-dependent oxidoreductase [Clostridia bacterium]|nr:FAD-dependent oxidoreductase [Clostridia bacterium]